MKHLRAFDAELLRRRPPPRLRVAGLSAASIALMLIAVFQLRAQAIPTDSVRHGMRLLFIGHFNPDAYPDSVWGTVYTGPGNDIVGYLPRVLVWGQPGANRRQEGGRSSGMELARDRDPEPRPYTLIRYPAWDSLHGYVSFSFFNSDSLVDMLITVRGSARTDTATADSSRMLLLYGQHALDSIAALDLGVVRGFHCRHFIAMEVRGGTGSPRSAVRTISGSDDWIFPPVDPLFNGPDTVRQAPGTGRAPHLRAYHDPATGMADIDARMYGTGAYRIEVVETNGIPVSWQNVELKAPADILRTVYVARIASGYYVVHVLREGQLLGTFPIAVLR